MVNKTRRRYSLWILRRRALRGWRHKVYCTLVECNLLTPLLRFVLDLLYNLFLHCCAAVVKLLTGTSRRFCDSRAELVPFTISVANGRFSVRQPQTSLSIPTRPPRTLHRSYRLHSEGVELARASERVITVGRVLSTPARKTTLATISATHKLSSTTARCDFIVLHAHTHTHTHTSNQHAAPPPPHS